MLKLRPMAIKTANEYVAKWHRHNLPVRVARFAVSCVDGDGVVHGVAIVGTPNARALTDGVTAEILRVATDGTFNACSILYGACCRACKAIGYSSVYTYTLHSESNASLKASGFRLDTEEAGGKPWKTRGRRFQPVSLEKKNRWIMEFAKNG